MSQTTTVSSVPELASFAHFLGNGKIEFVSKPVPRPGKGQLLIRNAANSLCGSDFPFLFKGGAQLTPGHEIAGLVVKAGEATHTPVGTRGVIFLMGYCGECRNCKKGHTNQCLQKKADYGFTHDGGYGSYSVINENVFFAIPDSVSYTEGTLLLDIMGTGGHAIKRARLVHDDPRSLLVLGAGPIGLGILAMAKILFGKQFPVLITDMVGYRLELAQQLGGLPIDLSKNDLRTGAAAHGFDAVDICIDSSGKELARRPGIDFLAQHGVFVCVGHGEGLDLKISPDLIATERAVLGSEYFCYNELADNLPLYLQHRDYLNQIITHTFPIAELETAFHLFAIDKNSGKVIVEHENFNG